MPLAPEVHLNNIFKKLVLTQQKTHSVFTTRTSSCLIAATIFAHFKNRTKHTARSVDTMYTLITLKQAVRIVTTVTAHYNVPWLMIANC
jgi:hypothetical protein